MAAGDEKTAKIERKVISHSTLAPPEILLKPPPRLTQERGANGFLSCEEKRNLVLDGKEKVGRFVKPNVHANPIGVWATKFLYWAQSLW